MNEQRFNELFRAARRVPPPVPEPGFENLVLAAVKAESARARADDASWFAGLALLWPRLGWTAAALMLLCAAAEWGASAMGVPGLSEGVVQLSDQWLLAATGF